MKEYTVIIRETSEKRVQITAESAEEAEVEARRRWEECEDEYILDASNFVDVDFTAM